MRILYKNSSGSLCAVDTNYLTYYSSYSSDNITRIKGLCFIYNGTDYYICKDIDRFDSDEYVTEAFKNGFVDLSNFVFKNVTEDIISDYKKDMLDFFM